MTISHAVITDPNIHEPRGITTAAADTVYIANGSGTGVWSKALVIDAGSVNNSPIGASTPSTGAFTTLSASGVFGVGSSSEITIAAGAVTITKSFHTVDTEADGATDDLTTINGGAVGTILVLRAENDARSVVLKHSSNLSLPGAVDFTLDNANDSITLLRISASQWITLASSSNGS